jgi:hypothetical protein
VVDQCDTVITSQPTNQVVLAGTTAQFTVGASSEFPLTYQWYFNQMNPVSPFASFPALTLPAVTLPAGGQYSVVVANTYGSVTSSVATLLVVAPLVTGVRQDASGNAILNFATLPNISSRVWATTNLLPPVVWQVISTNTADTNGLWQFIDTNTVGNPAKFYRFSTP